MTKQKEVLKKRTNKELLNDWDFLNNVTIKGKATIAQINVRGWLMDEIELRFPVEFNKWIDSSRSNNDIRKYIEVA